MATLKISDLSVGDWVRWKAEYGNTQIVRVTEIHWNCIIGEYKGVECAMRRSNIEPIPITAEILEKNGFERSTSEFIVYHTDKVWISYDKPSETWSVTMYINDFTSNLHANILHIHQLQRALSLANIDKEITL